MKTKFLIGACLFTAYTYAQEKKMVADFTKLQAQSTISVYLQKSDTPYVIAEMKGVKVDVNNSTLHLSLNKGDNTGSTKVTVGYKQLNQIFAVDVASVKTKDTLYTDNIKINTEGAASCKLTLVCNEVTCTAGDATSITLRGKANKLKAETNEASTLKAIDLLTDEVEVNTSGASTTKVYASKKLKGNSSGSSTLKYSGNPTITQLNETENSSIKVYSGGASSSIKITADSIDVAETKHDSTKHYKLSGGRYEFVIHNRKDKDSIHADNMRQNLHNWSGIELAENGFLTAGNNVTLPAKNDYMSLNYGLRNLSWNLNLFEKDFRFAHDHLQVVTGLGFSFNGFNMKNKTTLNADSSYTSNLNNINNGSITLVKNKLRESFVTVPLLLELNTSKIRTKNFHIAIGAIGGLKIGSSTKQVFTEDNKTYKDVRRNDYNLYPFKLDATVRVGYGIFTMYATYSLTPLFQTGKGPELYPFNLGIRIIPW